jgi:hypothetical protein
LRREFWNGSMKAGKDPSPSRPSPSRPCPSSSRAVARISCHPGGPVDAGNVKAGCSPASGTSFTGREVTSSWSDIVVVVSCSRSSGTSCTVKEIGIGWSKAVNAAVCSRASAASSACDESSRATRVAEGVGPSPATSRVASSRPLACIFFFFLLSRFLQCRLRGCCAIVESGDGCTSGASDEGPGAGVGCTSGVSDENSGPILELDDGCPYACCVHVVLKTVKDTDGKDNSDDFEDVNGKIRAGGDTSSLTISVNE